MMKSSIHYALAIAGIGLALGSPVRAAIVVTYAEDPSRETTSLSNAQVFDFNNLSTGVNNNVTWSGVGTFDKLFVKAADTYGGATDASHPNGTNYSVQGAGTSVSQTTLNLSTASGYFGFWWSAGDASNVLDFYKQGTLVAEFTTANLMTPLGSAYDGNPKNRSLDSHEPFAFLNFFGDADTTWDKIVFRNSSASGFESDNYTSRVSTYSPATDGSSLPGVTVARVSGTSTTTLSPGTTGSQLWGSSSAVPGAPAPPMSLLAVFGAVFLLKGKRRTAREA